MALELHDDYETLEAALALIDEWELEIGALAAPDSPSPSSDDCDARSTTTTASSTTDDSDASCSPSAAVTVASSASAPPRRRRAREDDDQKPSAAATQMSRREELVCLRRKVRELEGVLATMRESEDALVKTEETAEASQRELDAAWVWQQIASRQLEHRQRSERENLRLRVQVEEQVKVAKEVMRVLLRAYRQDEQEGEGGDEDRHARALKRVKLPQDARTEVSEEDQLRRVAELLDESAAVFAAKPFTGGLPVFRDVNVVQHPNGEATINVDSSWVVPFPVDQVMSSFWTHLMRKTKAHCDLNALEHCTAPDDGREVLVTRYESNATASKFAGKFFGRFVARRTHPEDDKPGFIIMDMSADPVGFKPMSMDGVRLHHETQMRVIWADQAAGGDAPPPPPSSRGRMSLVQMSQRFHVQLAAAETPTRRRRVGAMTNFFMYQVEAELDWKQDLLETLLMRAALSSS